MDQLPQDQQERIQIFQEITQITDVNICYEILEQNNWNVDVAVDNFVQNRVAERPTNSNVTHRRNRNAENNDRQNNTAAPTQNRPTGILDALWNPLRWIFQVRPVSLNPSIDTGRFLAEFETTYNSNHPAFNHGSYQSAVMSAFQQSKFLLVYIHSPMHEDTDKFCNQVLCTQPVTQFMDENLVVWGGSVWAPEAYGLSTQLRASSYPFMALLICQSERTVQVADRIEGFLDERPLIERLQGSMATFGGVINRMRDDILRREEGAALRAQQDQEYREAEQAELRERLRREREEEEQERLEHERQQAAELQEALEMSTRLTHEATIKTKRASLAPEPSSTSADVATIKCQLPLGSKVTRRFSRTDTVQTLYDYLSVQFDDMGSSVKNFAVSTHFPKKDLHDMAQTIDEVGLFPRGMVYVNDLDA